MGQPMPDWAETRRGRRGTDARSSSSSVGRRRDGRSVLGEKGMEQGKLEERWKRGGAQAEVGVATVEGVKVGAGWLPPLLPLPLLPLLLPQCWGSWTTLCARSARKRSCDWVQNPAPSSQDRVLAATCGTMEVRSSGTAAAAAAVAASATCGTAAARPSAAPAAADAVACDMAAARPCCACTP